MKNIKNQYIFFVLAGVITAGIIISSTITHKSAPKNIATNQSTSNELNSKSSAATSNTFNKTTHSLSDPSSIWLVVNKARQLNPKIYIPNNLVVPNIPLRANITTTEKVVQKIMAGPLETMVTAAKSQGINLNLQSGYRSYNFQLSLYNGYVAQAGQAESDKQSARPGYSEHQTGLAADLGGISIPSCNVAQCFADTVEGKWIAANAYNYGFIIRYPADKIAVTGYEYEPWHIRFIGTDLAQELHAKNIETLEEFFGLPAAPNY
ncbi:M15 family metallopeptidase [Candidatus Saccharibacteria bacterium]|nr:M15 family metallopeptidase [Candidatus Saccharibacteria bacterium]